MAAKDRRTMGQMDVKINGLRLIKRKGITTMITMENLSQAANPEQKQEIGEDVWDYFLEVLPPIFMNEVFIFSDGMKVKADFGFAEGYEPITVFWRENGKYFSRRSSIMNRS